MIEPTMDEFNQANDLIKRDLGFEYHPNRLPHPPLWRVALALGYYLIRFGNYAHIARAARPGSKPNHLLRAVVLWQYAVNLKVENMRLDGSKHAAL